MTSEGAADRVNGTILEEFVAVQKEMCQYPLSRLCMTLGAVFQTPFLTQIMAEAYVPVNALMLSISTLQIKGSSGCLSIYQYYYFIRLMGRKASHVALECALHSHPNMVILGEEVAMSRLIIFDITKHICDAIQARAEQEKYHSVVLIPKGLVESPRIICAPA